MDNRYIEKSKYGYLKLKSNVVGDLKEYYTNKYYIEIKQRYQDKLKKQVEKSTAPISNSQWMEDMYKEVLEGIEKHEGTNTKKVLDIGCGSGDFLQYCKTRGWKAVGIEPANLANTWNTDKMLDIYRGTVQDYIEYYKNEKYSCVTLWNVLEHVEDPVHILKDIYHLLDEQGVIYIKVPNEFNELQKIANEYVDKKDWWISIPDHVNYFNLNSLCNVVEAAGFEILERTCDFPMELFLLMGENYVDDGKVGQMCHEKRKLLEARMPKEMRQELYKQMAEMGLGRNIIVYARKVKSNR